MNANTYKRPILPTFLLLFVMITGCTNSTDVSQAPSAAEVQAAQQKRTAAVQERTDLTPEQKANLMKYQSGGGAPASGPSK